MLSTYLHKQHGAAMRRQAAAQLLKCVDWVAAQVQLADRVDAVAARARELHAMQEHAGVQRVVHGAQHMQAVAVAMGGGRAAMGAAMQQRPLMLCPAGVRC